MDKKQNFIEKYVSHSDYLKGKQYFIPYLSLNNKEIDGDICSYYFDVESERTSRCYEVTIDINKINGDIEDTYCDCPQYELTSSCKHIAAVLYHFYDQIIPKIITNKDKEKLAQIMFNIIEQISPQFNHQIKKEVTLEVYLNGVNYNANQIDDLNLELKIGFDKLYSCKGRKLSQFLDSYSDNIEFSFGKNFVYQPNSCYFSDENKKILDFLIFLNEHRDSYYNSYSLLSGRNTVKDFLKLISSHDFYLNDFLIRDIQNMFPLKSKLSKNDNQYFLKFIMEKDLRVITSDLEYIQINSNLYRLRKKDQVVLGSLLVNEMDEIIFDKKNKNKFMDTVLMSVSKKIDISPEINDFVISKRISVKLFFDFINDGIICNPIFIYDEDEVPYFSIDSNYLRDKDYENSVIEELYNYQFELSNNQFVLNDIDGIGNFIENDLSILSDKYEVFTSENLKKTNIIKKTTVRSTFSIGKDNIMSYSFSMDNIKDDEIVNILNALKKKKKYYRLKSGDIVNIENSKDINELDELMNDVNISEKDLSKGNLVIPKYRAIYLDSLKKNKYHIIETNNLFDELIENFYKYKDVSVDFDNEGEELLRDYQKVGVKWLYNIDKTGFGGILADEMGLGKSIQTIYYVKELLKEDKNNKFLIVSPTSLVYNWENEFLKFAPFINRVLMVGGRLKRRCNFESIKDVQVFITSYGMLREDFEYYKELSFRSMIIDEAQNIKNHSTDITKTVKMIKADTKFGLTGTPIENSIQELWSIFDFIMPGFLPDLSNFDKKYRIKDFDDDSNKKLKDLNSIISPFILRRRKRDVIKDLPEKIENNIYIEMSTEQKKLYLVELERVNKEVDRIISEGSNSKISFLILQLLTHLRQICIDPKIIYPDYNSTSGKMDEFVHTVEVSIKNNHKILVFTSFREALRLAKKRLDSINITSYVIDGSVSSKKRMELVDKFNEDDTNVFFIMLKAGGTGLNLTSADIVIHLDLWWNPQAENQATDRAHRIGQTKVVEVIKFITKGTIEEKILDLQNKKKILSDKLIDEGGEIEFNKLTEEDIRNLLSYNEK